MIKKFIVGILAFWLILFLFISLLGFVDTVVVEPYQLENATIDGIKHPDIFYVYELNLSGSKTFTKSVNYYNSSDVLSVYVKRGTFSHCIMDNVVINGVISK